jgi:hypothetical protein
MFVLSNTQARARWTKKFCDRWILRTADYTIHTVNGAVDTFFTLYVVYNKLCSHLALSLDPSKFNNVWETAVKVFPSALGSERIWTAVSNGNGLADISHLRALIADDGEFFLIAKRGTFDLESDKPKNKAIYDNLVSNNTDERVEAILEYIYRVRCNVFHGGKNLNNEGQLKILQPSIRCLDRVTKLGLDEVTRQSQDPDQPTH